MRSNLLRTLLGLLVLALFSINQASAGEFSVTVKNLTNGIYFTPLLITAHNASIDLFEPGESASGELQEMAEGGEIGGLTALVGGEDSDTIVNPAKGLLAPGESVSTELDTDRTRNRYLSIVAMLLPTNDGFVGMDSGQRRHRLSLGRYADGPEGFDASFR